MERQRGLASAQSSSSGKTESALLHPQEVSRRRIECLDASNRPMGNLSSPREHQQALKCPSFEASISTTATLRRANHANSRANQIVVFQTTAAQGNIKC